MTTPAEYTAALAAVEKWINENAGLYADMIPSDDIATVSKLAVDAAAHARDVQAKIAAGAK